MADHTYKLMVNGWYLLVIATHDATGRLLPIAFPSTTGEGEANIKELLEAVDRWVFVIFGERYLPVLVEKTQMLVRVEPLVEPDGYHPAKGIEKQTVYVIMGSPEKWMSLLSHQG